MKNVFFISALLYLLIGLATILLGWKGSDKDWIVSASVNFFSFNAYAPIYRVISLAPPLGMGVVYPPLLLLLVNMVINVGGWLGWTIEFVANMYSLLLFLADIFNVYLIISFFKQNNQKIYQKNINLVILTLFFSGYFLYTSGFMGHPETLVILFALLGIKFLRKKAFFLCGIFFGLAFISKQATLFIFAPVFFYLIFQKRKLRNIITVMSGILVVSLPMLLPFFIAHPFEVWYGIVGFNQPLIIRGPNIWWFTEAVLNRGSHLSWVGNYLKIIANPLLIILVSWLMAFFIKRNKIKPESPNFFGLIVLSLLTYHIFAKYIAFYNFLPAFVFVMIWDTVRNKDYFPSVGIVYAFVVFGVNFIDFPLRDLATLLANLALFFYLIHYFVSNKFVRN